MSLLCSCIMPSFRSPEVVEKAIRCFQAQTYGPKELVILRSDWKLGEWSGAADISLLAGVDIHSVPPGLSIGELRNIACRVARGSVLSVHDDDDWSHPERLSRSMDALKNADVVGTSLARYFDPAKKNGYLWDGEKQPAYEPNRLLGCTISFRRKVWEEIPFEDVKTGEDVMFLREAKLHGFRAHDLRDASLYAGRISDDNTSPKTPYPPTYEEIPYEGVFD